MFQELDSRLEPQVFLVGFLARASQGRPPVCLEPGEDFWLTEQEFRGVDLVQQHGFACLTSDSAPGDSSSGLQTELLLRRRIREAIALIIAKHSTFPAEQSYAVSMPSRVERYWVCAAVGLQNEVLRSHVALQAAEVRGHGRRIRVATSLIDAAMLEFLDLTTLELARPQPGRELSHIRSGGDAARGRSSADEQRRLANRRNQCRGDAGPVSDVHHRLVAGL